MSRSAGSSTGSVTMFWLEKSPGFPISRAIAEVLADPAKRRVPGRNFGV